MSLFSSLNLARLSLGAHQTAIQTVGQNIANAATEGYARQRVQMVPTPADDLVYARLGTGVRVDRIERMVDEHLETTLRAARSKLAYYGERDRIYQVASTVFNDLDGGGLSASIARFFDALEDLSSTPEDLTVRAQVAEEGATLAENFRFIDEKIRDMRSAFDEDVVGVVEEVNQLVTEIAELNKEVVAAEDGGLQRNTANDLRTRRDSLVGRLADLVSIKTVENSRGAVQVIAGTNVLVIDGRARLLEIDPTSDGDIAFHTARFTDDGKSFASTGGRLGALLEGRDQITVGMRAELDRMAGSFLDSFNAVHAGGEGLLRLGAVTAANAVGDRNAALSAAGYPFPIQDGRFTLQVVNEADGTRESYFIPVDLDGAGSDDTTLVTLAESIDALVGGDHPELSASISADGFLQIQSSSASLRFTFRDDETGFLRAAGLATFFTGTSARDMQVAAQLRDNPSLIAAGLGAGPGDNRAAQQMLALRDRGMLGEASLTIEEYYTSFIGGLGVLGAEARDFSANQQAITDSVRGQREALSGVSVDDEAIALIQYQRAYQGSARFLSVVDRLLETLMNV